MLNVPFVNTPPSQLCFMTLVNFNECQHKRTTVGMLKPQTTSFGLEKPIISQILLPGRHFKSSYRPLKDGQPLIFLPAKFPQLSLQHLEMFRALPAPPPFFCFCSLVQPALTGGQIWDPVEKDLYFYHLPRPVRMMEDTDLQDLPQCMLSYLSKAS